MTQNKISMQIDAYAQKNNDTLRLQEGKLGRQITKYEVAEYMLSKGILSKSDFEKWLKTQEGSQNKQQLELIKKTPLFMVKNQQRGMNSYLDKVSELNIGNIMGFEITKSGKIQKKKPAARKNFNLKQQIEEDKFKEHINKLPKAEGNPVETLKEIKAEEEQRKLQHMSVKERKEYIMGKFLDARNKNDKSGMYGALEEFFSYECSVIDEKLGITSAKNFIKDKSGLNALVDYIDKAVDDNNDKNLTKGEVAWNIIKGVGDALDSFIGSQGVMMVGAIGGATKAASAIPKAGPIVAGGIQAFFGVEGTKLLAEGGVNIYQGVQNDDADRVRQGGSEAAMGGIMVGGAVGSVRAVRGAKNAKITEAKLKAEEAKLKAEEAKLTKTLADNDVTIEKFTAGYPSCRDFEMSYIKINYKGKTYELSGSPHIIEISEAKAELVKALNGQIDRFGFGKIIHSKLRAPSEFLKPQEATNIKGQGISFKQAEGQPNYTATRIEWGSTVEETLALNRANGVNLEFVKDANGNEFFGIKDVWSDGYHRVDRNSVVMHYGDYKPSDTSVNADWVAKYKNPDGTIKDCAVVANDKGCKILENSYVTESGAKIDFATMEPGTKVHKDPNAVVNAFAYKRPVELNTLEGPIKTDITMGDVDGNVYNNFKQLKKQIDKGQLVPNETDPHSAKFIDLIKQGKDEEAISLLREVSSKTDRRIYFDE